MYYLIKKDEGERQYLNIVEAVEVLEGEYFIRGNVIEWLSYKGITISGSSDCSYFKHRSIFSSDSLDEVRERGMLEIL